MNNDLAKKYTRSRSLVIQLQATVIALFLYSFAAFQWSADLYRSASEFSGHFYVALLLYSLMLFAVTYLLGLPFAIVALAINRKYGMSKQTFSSWFLDYLKQAGLGLLVSEAATLCLFWAARQSQNYWWMLYWVATVVYRVAFALLLPSFIIPLFHKVSALPDGEAASRLNSLLARLHKTDYKLGVLHVTEKTRLANALVVGLGKGSKILLTDTLLAEFSPAEIEALTAHEIGHRVHHDIGKRLLVLSVLYFAALAVIGWLVSILADGAVRPQDLPLFMLGRMTARFYIAVILAAFMRRQEQAADRYSWNAIEDVSAYITAMKKLATQNLIPGDYRQQWAHSHPALNKRIKEAEKVLAQRLAAKAAVPATGG